jgi:hypothetical protein
MTLMLPAGIDGEQTPMMLKIACPCGHTGIVSDGHLPCELHCWSCGTSRHVEPDRSARIISTAAREEWINNFLAAAR